MLLKLLNKFIFYDETKKSKIEIEYLTYFESFEFLSNI